ncbi:MAG TPA: hypothetical protein VLG16_02340 [Candidatus Saccharimonadales bacterium]|nr:hypothetical protein [Candidatus Saccharimonadales bacterium]
MANELSPNLAATSPLQESLTEPQPISQFAQVAARFGMDADEISRYLKPGEQLTGFGTGGSESLVMFLDTPAYGAVVRKVCSEGLSAVGWDPNGAGVMTPPSSKGGLQVDYLKGLPESVAPYFPRVYSAEITEEIDAGGRATRKLIYDQSMLRGIEISSFVADAQPSPTVVAHLHRQVMSLLSERIHNERRTLNTEDTIGESYLDKITARLELSRNAAPETFGSLLDSDSLIINGRTYPNIGELQAFFSRPEIREMLEPRYHSLVMGDTNTENVMITNPEPLLEAMKQPGKPDFTYDDLGLRFLDPRAIGFRSSGASTIDDPMYDNKPVHNSIGNYDVMHGEHFYLDVNTSGNVSRITIDNHDNNPYTKSYHEMGSRFKYVMEGWDVSSEEFQADDPNWLLRFTFMMGSHFAAMPPFHFKRNDEGLVPEDPEVQKRAIAIFSEGIKWLTAAREMITGKRKSLFGVELADIQPSNRSN